LINGVSGKLGVGGGRGGETRVALYLLFFFENENDVSKNPSYYR
jgi:hypothetical protein